MREIKFRGKRIDNGEWVYGFPAITEIYPYNKTKFMGYIWKIPCIDTLVRVDFETIGQYTGLKDKNGVEIYEGDIVKNTLNVLVDKELFGIIYSIRGGGLCWRDGNGNEDCFYDVIAENSEVISNIHDNPELLGGAE